MDIKTINIGDIEELYLSKFLFDKERIENNKEKMTLDQFIKDYADISHYSLIVNNEIIPFNIVKSENNNLFLFYYNENSKDNEKINMIIDILKEHEYDLSQLNAMKIKEITDLVNNENYTILIKDNKYYKI